MLKNFSFEVAKKRREFQMDFTPCDATALNVTADIGIFFATNTRNSTHPLMSRVSLLLVATMLACGAPASVRAQSGLDPNTPKAGTWRLSAEGGAIGLGCDITTVRSNYRYKPYAELAISSVVHRRLHLGLYANGGTMAAMNETRLVKNSFGAAGLSAEYRIPVARGMIVPFVFARIGGIVVSPTILENSVSVTQDRILAMTYGGGAGFELVFRRKIGIRMLGGGFLTTSDKLDGLAQGTRNDGAAFFSIGAAWYFSSR